LVLAKLPSLSISIFHVCLAFSACFCFAGYSPFYSGNKVQYQVQ